MQFDFSELLSALMTMSPARTCEAPRHARGLYGLVDHFGDLRYIGSTSSPGQSLHERIHQRHRTGSEDTSHYFSSMYNTGRMWRDRKAAQNQQDGLIAKELRSAFIADHCRAVWLQLPDDADIAGLEAAVLRAAPAQVTAWNRRKMPVYDEPVVLVDETLHRLNWDEDRLAALVRQRERSRGGALDRVPVSQGVPPLPQGPFRFVALDVETANHDRASICQIGLAFVRPDNSIVTWKTYVDPLVDRWVFTGLHGIDAKMVRGAPSFAALLPNLCRAIAGLTVYQHSGFDRSAFAAACAREGLEMPQWDWRDSVTVARGAWPELKGQGGHGLANLKVHLGLVFDHHDAGEDARAAAEVVLAAQGRKRVVPVLKDEAEEDMILIDIDDVGAEMSPATPATPATPAAVAVAESWFMLSPEIAMAYGRPVVEGFLVRAGSTVMRNGSPLVKRDRELRDSLLRRGVLVEDGNPALYGFATDHVFANSSAAGGVVKEGNCSGPQSWRRVGDKKSLKSVSG